MRLGASNQSDWSRLRIRSETRLFDCAAPVMDKVLPAILTSVKYTPSGKVRAS
ncbi:hypothetical protein D3C72_2438100 [compost metagenome]